MIPTGAASDGQRDGKQGQGGGFWLRWPTGLRSWRLLLAAALVLLVVDLVRSPSEQLSAAVLLAGIDAYRVHLSPRLSAAGGSCRFRPTCSSYGRQVIARDGALVGTARTAGRIARCGPWTPKGTEDFP